MIKEFSDFLKNYGVIGLAIGVIIGGKLNALVTSLVNDLVMPLVFQPLLTAAGVDEISKLHWNGVYYGKLISATIDFTIVAFIIFLFAKFILKEATVAKK
jgi:large conductance mechanosensitive channel